MLDCLAPDFQAILIRYGTTKPSLAERVAVQGCENNWEPRLFSLLNTPMRTTDFTCAAKAYRAQSLLSVLLTKPEARIPDVSQL